MYTCRVHNYQIRSVILKKKKENLSDSLSQDLMYFMNTHTENVAKFPLNRVSSPLPVSKT